MQPERVLLIHAFDRAVLFLIIYLMNRSFSVPQSLTDL
jgi:hypothetical protein